MRRLIQSVAAAVLLAAVLAGVAANATWIKTTVSGDVATSIAVAVVVLSAAYKALVPAYLPHAPRAMWLVLVPLFAAALAFDALCEVGFANMTRGTKLEQHAEALADYARKSKAVDDAKRELDSVPAPKSSAATLGRKADAARGGRACKSERERDTPACQTAADYEAQRDDAAKGEASREKAQRRLDAARLALESTPTPPESVDPQAAAVRRILAPFVSVTERGAATLFSLLIVAVVELGQIAGVYLMLNPPGSTERRAPPAAPSPRAGRRPNVASEVILGTIERLADGRMSWPGVVAGAGEIRAPQRQLAAALGLKTASAVSRALGVLETEGFIEMSAGPGGTCVRLKRA